MALPDGGGIFGFLGPNGAGKTTSIRILLGLLRASAGEARIFGLDCWREGPAIRRELGYLPGDPRFYARLTGEATVKLAGAIRGADLLPHARRLAEEFDFNLKIRAGTMSRGTQQKLGLILAMAHEPRLLILDEPTNGLDPIIVDRLMNHLRGLAARGRTVFFSSHALSTVEQLCDRVAILRQGKLVADTTLDELRARAAREVQVWWRGAARAAADGLPAVGLPAGLEVIGEGEMGTGSSGEGGPSRYRWRGAIDPLMRWLTGDGMPPIEDLVISPPDLESIFHEYYR